MAGLSLVFCRRTQGSERESHLLGVTHLGGLRNSSLCFPREQSLVNGFSCCHFVRVDAGGPDPLGLCILVSQITSRAPPSEGAVQAEQGHVCRISLGAGQTARTMCCHMRGLVGFRGQRWERTGTQPEPGVSRDRGVSGGCREDARGVGLGRGLGEWQGPTRLSPHRSWRRCPWNGGARTCWPAPASVWSSSPSSSCASTPAARPPSATRPGPASSPYSWASATATSAACP